MSAATDPERFGWWKRFFVGVATDPALVAAVRAFFLQVLPIATLIAVAWLMAVTDPRWVWLAVPAAGFLRVAEGVIDRQLKATQNDVYPRPPAGETRPEAPPREVRPLTEAELRGELIDEPPGDPPRAGIPPAD